MTIISCISAFLLITVTGTALAQTHHHWCYDDYPILDGLLCYKKCAEGYYNWGGGPVCWANCPDRTTNMGVVCTKDAYGRGVGVPLSTCTSSQDKNGLLCYPECRSGYYGVGPVCWSYCRSGYDDDGALCRRNAHIYGRDVGSCPWYDKCGLCGGPWYNVCCCRRNCGGTCKMGYTNDGCTCRRDVHIYAKSSYGRGAGFAMGCDTDEEQDGALCYPPCSSGYRGVGPLCWPTCSGETIDTGAQCQKKSYGRGVGKVISCLTPPSLSSITNYTGLVEIFKKAEGFQNIQAVGCAVYYMQLKFWVTFAQTFNNCNKEGHWQTISVSYSSQVSDIQSSGMEIGIGVDIFSSKGLCYIGYCTGWVTDVSAGVSITFAWWRMLDDIKGKSKAFQIGIDIPFTEIGFTASFISNTDQEYVGTQFSFGIGYGINPIEIGYSKCNTPSDLAISFTI